MTRHWQVLVAAWRERNSGSHGFWHAAGIAFLPAALEIQESPPSPLGRATVWVIMIGFALAVGWACLGKVDIVSVASGKLIPPGKSKVIQPLRAGIVTRVHVQDGRSVSKGDPLIDLDSSLLEADRVRIQSELMFIRAAMARLGALQERVRDPDNNTEPEMITPRDVSAEVVAAQTQMMGTQWDEHRARSRALRTEVKRHKAAWEALREELKKQRSIIPIVEKRTRSIKILMEKRLAAEQEYLSREQERIEHVQGLAILEKRLLETEQAIHQAQAQRSALDAEFKKTLSRDGLELSERKKALEQDLVKLETQLAQQHLKAPVDGFVQQLTIHTVGAVVTQAQPLMIIVPTDHILEVEAWIKNKDIGFVREGQSVEVKVDAFPFTRYGTIPGRIKNISNDAVENKEAGSTYSCRVRLVRSAIHVEDQWVQLAPGMSVSVEIKTGRRRLIEYFLSPLLRYTRESVRER